MIKSNRFFQRKYKASVYSLRGSICFKRCFNKSLLASYVNRSFRPPYLNWSDKALIEYLLHNKFSYPVSLYFFFSASESVSSIFDPHAQTRVNLVDTQELNIRRNITRKLTFTLDIKRIKRWQERNKNNDHEKENRRSQRENQKKRKLQRKTNIKKDQGETHATKNEYPVFCDTFFFLLLNTWAFTPTSYYFSFPEAFLVFFSLQLSPYIYSSARWTFATRMPTDVNMSGSAGNLSLCQSVCLFTDLSASSSVSRNKK